MAERKYKTRQRDEIMRFFEDNAEKCFTANDVYNAVEAGEATVFRALTALYNEGRLKKFSSSRGESAYYQYSDAGRCATHLHLKCEDCGRLIHMDCGFLSEMTEHFKSEHGFSLDSSKTVIYGLCEDCGARGKTEGKDIK